MKTAFIVIDSGFDRDVIRRANVIGVYDLRTGLQVEGAPFVADDVLDAFAGDPGRHGTIVLGRYLDAIGIPDAPVILVRAFGDDGLITTQWGGYDATFRGGNVTRPGWTEALLWATGICRARALQSVTNCSFGGFRHAADGTGWEASRLSEATAGGGHIIVAAAGAGDGRSAHASWRVPFGGQAQVKIFQRQTATYNMWADVRRETGDDRQWSLEVYNRHGHKVHESDSRQLVSNIWNGKQQLRLQLDGDGEFTLVVRNRSTTGGEDAQPIAFQCWSQDSEHAYFLSHVDPLLVVEPAVFPDVIAVGLQHGTYNPRQAEVGQKPDVLVPGDGPISFRAPELAALVATMLEAEPGLGVQQVRDRLGKYPLHHRST